MMITINILALNHIFIFERLGLGLPGRVLDFYDIFLKNWLLLLKFWVFLLYFMYFWAFLLIFFWAATSCLVIPPYSIFLFDLFFICSFFLCLAILLFFVLLPFLSIYLSDSKSDRFGLYPRVPSWPWNIVIGTFSSTTTETSCPFLFTFPLGAVLGVKFKFDRESK